jgi:hypothetical protein
LRRITKLNLQKRRRRFQSRGTENEKGDHKRHVNPTASMETSSP